MCNRLKPAGRTAIFFGLQNCTPMEGDIRLLEILHTLGVRFMQLAYNQQSLLASGCFEDNDNGVSRAGREAIAEMNRLGMVVDLSHAAERSMLEAMEISSRPTVVTHANPAFWHNAPRNLSDVVLRALAQSGGMLGFSLYPHHLKDGPSCTLQSFCDHGGGDGGNHGCGKLRHWFRFMSRSAKHRFVLDAIRSLETE